MLSELRVEQLGIIEEATVVLGPGLTVITGETGAGKTLLIDALQLLCGGRADPSMVREGAVEARVEARFVADGCLSADAPVGFAEGEIVVARVVPGEGRSRGYVNGRLATAAELAALTADLVDLHGQHSQQALLTPAAQRAVLDAFAGEPARRALSTYRTARAEAREIDERIAALGGDEQARAREVDLLRHQIDEIEAAGPVDPGEDDRLAAEADLLGDAEAVREALTVAQRALAGGTSDGIAAALGALGGREAFSPLVERLRGLQAEAADLAAEVRGLADGLSADPGRLAAVQARRAVLRDLMRRYGPDIDSVIAFLATARDRRVELEQRDEHVAALEAERAAVDARGIAARAELSAVRREAAGPFATGVTARLRDLALPAADFTVAVSDGDPGEDGADDVVFLLAPNPGEPARPVARAASGGELSRVMLAIRLVSAVAPPTVVFDEVDAGIGGEAGIAVGAALAALGVGRQVLCVTHLAQVAAAADAHVAVAKATVGARTVARVDALDAEARVGEITRMLSGLDESASARRHAEELLDRARSQR